MISHKYRCIFVHIPKCAGTSVESALEHYPPDMTSGMQDHRSIREIEQPGHYVKLLRSSEGKEIILDRLIRPARAVKNKVTKTWNPNNFTSVTPQQYHAYFKFSVVRNPWDRAVSWYRNVIDDSGHQSYLGVSDSISFPEFLYKFIGEGPLRTQLYWLRNADDFIPLDFICRFESLHSDMDIVFDALGMTSMKLPHKLKSNTVRSYRDYYSDELAELVRYFYAEEIEFFNYDF